MGTLWVLSHVALPAYKLAGVVIIWLCGTAVLLYILRRFGR